MDSFVAAPAKIHPDKPEARDGNHIQIPFMSPSEMNIHPHPFGTIESGKSALNVIKHTKRKRIGIEKRETLNVKGNRKPLTGSMRIRLQTHKAGLLHVFSDSATSVRFERRRLGLCPASKREHPQAVDAARAPAFLEVDNGVFIRIDKANASR